ncbi:Hypothetical protein SFBmNL_00403 [Candidatus Arthromitus sp. SFB-mouse-NL]|uniref:dATP/dGTP diphosphohydrolase domain-containing protein n=1 Tax=Candidatus Arthromitus sp. SFB-mouse-NL TaxID=1508644 RepID=UPI00049B147C|nr:dATP/dGTP diphosphohydrolase domain-containing protein [Candidatus Arthromitus sp. SFB-mouse-NL]AID44321.1 Hypothetical protein SFBmNL_00403 [Candidatus Arthromitus sp. SFB-mouse-NL]
MRTFASGAIRDDNDCKGRCDLIPLDIVINVKEDKPLNLIHNFKVSGEVEHLIDLLKLEMNEDIYNVLLDVSHRFGLGAIKYGDHNWQKGIPANVYIDSGTRHYLKYMRGDNDEDHHAAYIWNIMCCIWTCEHLPELNIYGILV